MLALFLTTATQRFDVTFFRNFARPVRLRYYPAATTLAMERENAAGLLSLWRGRRSYD
jgi:hypothetical protein